VSPTLQNSRNGGLVAQAWAALAMRGRDSLEADAKSIHSAWTKLRDFIKGSPHLNLHGEPSCANIAWIPKDTSKIDPYKLGDAMHAIGGWEVYLLQHPPACMLPIGNRQAPLIESFIKDLEKACEAVIKDPSKFNRKAPTYGAIAQVPPGPIMDDFFATKKWF